MTELKTVYKCPVCKIGALNTDDTKNQRLCIAQQGICFVLYNCNYCGHVAWFDRSVIEHYRPYDLKPFTPCNSLPRAKKLTLLQRLKKFFTDAT